MSEFVLKSPIVIPNFNGIGQLKPRMDRIDQEFKKLGWKELPINLKKHMAITRCERCDSLIVWEREIRYCSKACRYPKQFSKIHGISSIQPKLPILGTRPPIKIPRKIYQIAFEEYNDEFPGNYDNLDAIMDRGGLGTWEIIAFLYKRILRLEAETK